MIDNGIANNETWRKYYQAQGNLKETLRIKAVELKQKAKEKWITEGDECTKFYLY
jgi:hypothetical protein